MQLRIMQEVIALVVFPGFVFLFSHQPLRWNHLTHSGLILAALYSAFLPGVHAAARQNQPPDNPGKVQRI